MFNIDLEGLLSLVIAVVLAMSIHEMAHGLVSYWLGDPTAKMQGRISLNPFAHVDWLGVLCLLLFHFGWAKPVPIDASYYQDRRGEYLQGLQQLGIRLRPVPKLTDVS